jgi:calcineurin-like phosphoesterase family protein
MRFPLSKLSESIPNQIHPQNRLLARPQRRVGKFMTTYFTSDQHYGHANIIKYCNRPFRDVDDMRETMIANHNSVVKDGDEVWHLGDFSMSEKQVQPILSRLNGKHILVMGNHDICHPLNRRCDAGAIGRYLDYGFEAVLMDLEDMGFLMHHMPYSSPDEHDKRYLKHRPGDSGKILLHGHVHEKWKTRGRMINVGVDVWNFTPVSLDTIKDLAKTL